MKNFSPTRAWIETVLLFAVFVLAEWIWPVADFLEGK